MAIDTRACIGCWTCAVACKQENNLPDGVWWCKVITVGGDSPDTPAGTYPNLSMGYTTLSCQLCAEPACAAACPTQACHVSDLGVVVQDADLCVGCRYCIQACPYPGVRTYLAREPEHRTDYPTGGLRAARHAWRTVEKCDLCHHLLASGEPPACIDVCPGHARVFGDLNDPGSLISRTLAARESFRLCVDAGTEPSVYYLR